MHTALDPFEIAARRFELQGAAPWYNNPVGFAREFIRWPADEGLTCYQCEIMQTLQDRRRVAARGPHGLGKTAMSAIIVLWFALTRDAAGVDWKIATTSGSWRQLIRFLWPEIHKFAGRLDWEKLQRSRFKVTELQNLNLKLRYGHAYAVSSTNPALIEGAHADSLLYVYDESKSIAPGIFDASEGAFSGASPSGGLPEAFALAISTPGDPVGRFYDIHARAPGLADWSIRHVTLQEAIDAGRVSADWARARAEQWGANSQLYYNRVLGEFRTDDTRGVLPLAWIEAAIERWHEWDEAGRPVPPGRRVFGADIAYGGADLTVIAKRTGPIVWPLTEYNIADTVKVAQLLDQAMVNQTDLSVVDVNGFGAGVVDTLRHIPRPVIAFSAGRKTGRRDRSGELGFVNQRAMLWWSLRESLDPAFDPQLALPPDDNLVGELVAPTWWTTPSNKIAVEPKSEVIERLGRSTDRADAVGQSLLTEANFDQDDDASLRGAVVQRYRDGHKDDEDHFPWDDDSAGETFSYS